MLADRRGRYRRVMLLLLGATVSQVTAAQPIRIDDCRILNSRSFVSAYGPVVVTFTNERRVPADEVSFTIEYGGRTERFIDKGAFSPDVRIEHAFNGFYDANYRGPTPTRCGVDYVHFSDGSSWSQQL
jgi:hypothetical protein